MSAFNYSKWDAVEVSSSERSSHTSDDDEEERAGTQVCGRTSAGQLIPATDALASTDLVRSFGDGDHHVKAIRLTYPSRVVVGPNGVHTEIREPPKATASPFRNPPGARTAQLAEGQSVVVGANTSPGTSTGVSVEGTDEEGKGITVTSARGAVEDGDVDQEDEVLYAKLMERGGREGDSHLWSQTRETVTVAFLVPMRTKGTDIHNFCVYKTATVTEKKAGTEEEEEKKEGATPPAPTDPHGPSSPPTQEQCCVISFENTCSHRSNSSAPTATAPQLRRTFRYFVKVPPLHDVAPHNDEEADGDDAFDESCWQLLTLRSLGLRLLVVQLFKEPVAQGVYHWWDRCFATDVESTISTNTIDGRQPHYQSGSAAGPAEAGAAVASADCGADSPFQSAWDEAHRAFAEKVKSRKAKSSPA